MQDWLFEEDEKSSFMLNFTRRLEILSNLTIIPYAASDAYQVAAYGPSHYYAPHTDAVNSTENNFHVFLTQSNSYNPFNFSRDLEILNSLINPLTRRLVGDNLLILTGSVIFAFLFNSLHFFGDL